MQSGEQRFARAGGTSCQLRLGAGTKRNPHANRPGNGGGWRGGGHALSSASASVGHTRDHGVATETLLCIHKTHWYRGAMYTYLNPRGIYVLPLVYTLLRNSWGHQKDIHKPRNEPNETVDLIMTAACGTQGLPAAISKCCVRCVCYTQRTQHILTIHKNTF